jgi:hypothetical protein
MLSGRVADKLIFTAIYVMAAVMMMWGVRITVNYALDVRFYQTYLSQWRVRLLAMQDQAPGWPEFDGRDSVRYMETLVAFMSKKGVRPPQSNTDRPFIYRLAKFGDRAQQILVVFDHNSIMLFGLPATTFDRLDHFIDGVADPDHGDFRGRWSSDQISRIGRWKI